MQESQNAVLNWAIASIVGVLVLFALAGRDVDRTTAMAPETRISIR